MKKLLAAALLFAFICLQGIIVHGATTISVSQFVEHPALDAVLLGFQDYLKEKGIDAKYNVHNAQANMGTASQIAQQMVGEKADLLVAIATPSAQTCVQALSKAPADLKRPFLFTASWFFRRYSLTYTNSNTISGVKSWLYNRVLVEGHM